MISPWLMNRIINYQQNYIDGPIEDAFVCNIDKIDFLTVLF